MPAASPQPERPRRARSRLTSQSGITGDEAYWDARQAALGIETHGETLEPDEIEFCERFGQRYPNMALSEVLKWVKTSGHGTSDFTWLAGDGEDWELKSPVRPDYDAIKRRIRDDMRKGKTRFMIDLGGYPLDAELHRSLANYKAKRGIAGLAVLSNDGATLTTL